MVNNVSLKNKGEIFTLQKGKVCVGRCKLYRTNKHSAILGNFIVYKRYRNKGYGSVLLSSVIKTRLNIMLWVDIDNPVAYRLYTKHGFKQIGMGSDKLAILFLKQKM